jgi:hypothetical protein
MVMAVGGTVKALSAADRRGGIDASLSWYAGVRSRAGHAS